MIARSAGRPRFTEAAMLDHVAFWSPLPGAGQLSRTARNLVRESEADINAQRLESALDASVALIAEEPEFVPGFIRTTELLVATQRRDHAKRLLKSLQQRQAVMESSDFELELSRIQAHIEPNVNQIRAFAQKMLDEESSLGAAPYVPYAITALSETGETDESIKLASQWVGREPKSPLALAYLVRAHLSNGDGQSALRTIRSFRDEYEADRIWPENIAVSALAAIASPDLEPKWLAAGPVCQGLRSRTLAYDQVKDILEFLIPSFAVPQRALLLAGLIAVNAGDDQEARAIFQTTPAETSVESYLRNVGLERSTRSDEDQRARVTALKEIWTGLNDPQVASVAETSEIFDPPATRARVGLEIARTLEANEAHSDALKFLNEVIKTGANDPEIVRLQAELMGKSGSRNDALATLDELARQQEENRAYADAVETLDSMVKLLPGNIRLRQRIVDNCLKSGRFDQAIDQLVMQGRLLHKAGRVIEAEAPVHRAIEVGTMTSSWDTVKKLHRLLISFAPEETRLRHAAVATYVQHGYTSEAIDQLREIVRIARKLNDMDEAIAASHQMLALDPNDPATYHQLGELLVSIQEYNQADRVYRRLASLVPDDHAVKAKRSAIAALTRSRQQSDTR